MKHIHSKTAKVCSCVKKYAKQNRALSKKLDREAKKRKPLKIESVSHLRDILQANEGNGYLDFALVLGGGGMFSRKEMMYDSESKKFLINNCIDDSEQDLTEKQLQNKKYTNIGEAITKGSFYQIIY